jgi:hypothetical protein
MTSTIKVNNIQNQCGANIINENSNTITIGASGDTIALASGASQTGFGRTGTVDWDTTPKTATFSAVSGDGFFCNTTAGTFTCNLPAGAAGAIVSLADYAGTWQTNNLTVSPNGTEKIGGVNANVTLNTEGQSVTFVYVDSTQGWINVQDSTSNVRGSEFIVASGGTITECGNDKIHTFTGPGTFTVSAAGACASNNVVSYLVVAGGGSGGGDLSGGGGAGGFREYKSPVTPYTASPLNGNPGGTAITVSAQAYPITVGGGASTPSPNIQEGCRGTPSIFSTITSTGGGAGMVRTSSQSGPPAPAKAPGGSGGGASYSNGTNGTGNTPPVSPPQGNNGGTAPGGTSDGAAGGGGATAAGQAAAGPTSGQGNGGAGATTSISGSPTAYSGGGGGGEWSSGGAGSGGTGGGGAGGSGPGSPAPGANGSTNRGGGGGGGNANGSSTGGQGGSGIVIIRYKFQ